jgi:hypothetical protein
MSPARPGAGSIKRKPDDDSSYAAIAAPSIRIQPANFLQPEKIEKLTVDIAKVTSLCDKIGDAIAIIPEDPVRAILMDINAAIKIVNNNHAEIIKDQPSQPIAAAAGVPAANSDLNMVSLGAVPKRNRTGESFPEMPRYSTVAATAAAAPPPILPHSGSG